MENTNVAEAVRHLSRRDPLLRRVIQQAPECRLKIHSPNFHSLARSIVYQQLSGKAAATIFGRLQDTAGVRTLTARAVLSLPVEALRGAGLSGQKAAYLLDLAEQAAAGRVRFRQHPRMTDEAIIEELTRVKGIGVWTVQMYLMFALERLDVFPVLDLGVRKGIERVYEVPAGAKAAELQAVAERWRPYRSVGSWYMWRALEI
jgi:DNA-3-methyladenine glycosylase II